MRVPIVPASDEDTDHSEIICMHFGHNNGRSILKLANSSLIGWQIYNTLLETK